MTSLPGEETTSLTEIPPQHARSRRDERGDLIRRLLEICAEADLQLPPEILATAARCKIPLPSDRVTISYVAVPSGDANSVHNDELYGSYYYNASFASTLSVSSFQSTGSVMQDAILAAKILKEEMEKQDVTKKFHYFYETLEAEFPQWELRVVNGSYDVTTYSIPKIDSKKKGGNDDVPPDEETPRPKTKAQKIPTVFNGGCVYVLLQRLLYFARTGKQPKPVECSHSILKDINLRFESGKMYLLLGAPGAGKSTLLKYISNLLHEGKHHVVGGSLLLNGVSPTDRHFEWTNLVCLVDQLDNHHEYLTVKETFEYAFNCRKGGTHRSPYVARNTKNDAIIANFDAEKFFVNLCLEALGLKRVEDTFVGNDVNVRGVSGGERKRVTLGELLCAGAPVFCMDEISTGLDAATTFDICKSLAQSAATTNSIRIVSLLAPSPEIAALFDEMILIDEGKIIYSGPVSETLSYFSSLGYEMPERIDPGEWLLSLSSKDRSPEEFSAAFKSSNQGRIIQEKISTTFGDATNHIVDETAFSSRYHTSWYNSLWLVTSHELTLWRRNTPRIRARLIQSVVMGLFIGTVFYKQGDNPYSGIGVLYQVLMFLAMGSLPVVFSQVDNRPIVYKHLDRNFYRALIFVFGRCIATIPAIFLDIILYGVVVFFLSGMAYNDGATFWNFVIFLLLLFMTAFTTASFFSIFSALAKDTPNATALMTLSILLMILFSGFTVQPAVIPNYWIWLYWLNYFAWMLRAVLINQYGSGKFGEEGELILIGLGFSDKDGQAYQFIWVWYAVLFACGTILFSLFANAMVLTRIRYRAKATSKLDDDSSFEIAGDAEGDLPFQRANLTFTNIYYSVKSSISKERIELLKGVDGYFAAGKMTALMGSSGAGKTTLMDVLSLRKTKGKIKGEIMVNGHPQESGSFRRCMGYVEQFDVQSEQLTVKETIVFSAKMRLDRSGGISDDSILKFVDKTIRLLELQPIQDCLVGSGVGDGLSFEQKKRLGIAVEVASNPSILFLDEPTSGLDATSAATVMRGLRRIADGGRAVCATIHQPSTSIFNSFDNLLLLKRGGEPVFFGQLGEESCDLIKYFESFETTPKIRSNENPATWMLNIIGSGTNATEASQLTDYAAAYALSKLHKECLEKISEFLAEKTENNEIRFPTKYATSLVYQVKKVYIRMSKVYWRSPSYNRTRLITGAAISLLFGSVYASQRVPTTEIQLNSICNSIYISVFVLGLSAYAGVLTFFENERNMFYRHKAALMYDHKSLTIAAFWSEIPFILLVSMIFTVCFYFPLGFVAVASKFFYFYLFVTLNVALWTFVGQMFISLFRDAVTAQGFGALFIGMTGLFTGNLIAPQNIPQVWIWAYWVFPLHYVIEGLLVSQYYGSNLQIEAIDGGSWYISLQCSPEEIGCYGTPYEYLLWRFGGFFTHGHLPYNVLYLFVFVTVTNIVKLIGLKRFNFLSK